MNSHFCFAAVHGGLDLHSPFKGVTCILQAHNLAPPGSSGIKGVCSHSQKNVCHVHSYQQLPHVHRLKWAIVLSPRPEGQYL